MIRVLVADDSAVTREYLVFLLGRDPALAVAGTARDGVEAVEQAERLRPDVIVMDIHMPRMDGFEATRQIMGRVPTPIVIVTASLRREEASIAFESLLAGAVSVMAKPDPDREETIRQLVETVKLMSEVKVVRRWSSRRGPALPAPPRAGPERMFRIVAIGASTGGPVVVREILAALPKDFPVPILIAQHIAPGFVANLADWLDGAVPLTVKVAEPNEQTQPGTVYFPPDEVQMGITKEGRILLTREAAEGGFCPSVSYLLRSVAEAYGRAAIGALLTGMGRDGALGLRQLRDAGGLTMAQDEESSAVFGMPREALRLGAAEFMLPPDRIAARIRSLVTPAKD